MSDFISGDSTLAPLVAPLAPQSVSGLKKYRQSTPKVSPKWQKYHRKWLRNAKRELKSGTDVLKSASKGESKSDSTSDSKDESKNETVCLQSLFVSHPARRTARSALNKFYELAY